MAYKIEYKSSVAKDLKKIDKKEAKRIINKLEKELSEDPNKGIRLKGQFEGLYKYRVGDYRAIYTKTVDGVLVVWMHIAKRIQVEQPVSGLLIALPPSRRCKPVPSE